MTSAGATGDGLKSPQGRHEARERRSSPRADSCRIGPAGSGSSGSPGIMPSTPCAAWRCSWSSACTRPSATSSSDIPSVLWCVRDSPDPAGLRLVLLVVDGGLEPPLFHDRRVLRRPPVRFPRLAGLPGEPGPAGRRPVPGRRRDGPPGLPGAPGSTAGWSRAGVPGGRSSGCGSATRRSRPSGSARATLVPRIPARDAAGVRRRPVVARAPRRGPDPVPAAWRACVLGSPWRPFLLAVPTTALLWVSRQRLGIDAALDRHNSFLLDPVKLLAPRQLLRRRRWGCTGCGMTRPARAARPVVPRPLGAGLRGPGVAAGARLGLAPARGRGAGAGRAGGVVLAGWSSSGPSGRPCRLFRRAEPDPELPRRQLVLDLPGPHADPRADPGRPLPRPRPRPLEDPGRPGRHPGHRLRLLPDAWCATRRSGSGCTAAGNDRRCTTW